MVDSLAGIRVLDLTRILAGPYATMILGDLGAEIIKIERPDIGDEARGFGPFKNDFSLYFMSINRGKKSVTLNLKDPRGKKIFLDLVKKSDIVIENFRPGTMKKLGLDYQTLKEHHPSLVYAACSGFGQTGPYATRGAYDMIIQGMGGILSITGEPNRPPVRVGTSIGDITSALFTAIGIFSALRYRDQTGEGQLVDVGMLDCQVAILENALMRYFSTNEIPQPLGRRHSSITPFEVFESKDNYVVIAIGNNELWEKFCQHINKSDLINDQRFCTNALRTENHAQLFPILTEITTQFTTDHWIKSMESIGVPCGPVNTIDKVVTDPQVLEREMIVEVEHETTGALKIPGIPIKLSKSPGRIEHPAPNLSQHTMEVLKELLDIDETEIETLKQDKVI